MQGRADRLLTLEGVHIEALVFPVQIMLLHLILQEASLGIIGGDDTVLLALCLELLSNFKDCCSFSGVLHIEK